MPEKPDSTASPERSPVERLTAPNLADQGGLGRPLPRSSMQRRRTVEGYLRAGVLPRYMQRLREIHDETERQRRMVGRAYRQLEAACGSDAELFAERWREKAHAWSFDSLNDLIGEHNRSYPIEARLPMDPRTGDYVKVAGRSYRRRKLGPRWVLEQFPASRPSSRGARS